MVRLKDMAIFIASPAFSSFNSKNGAIKSIKASIFLKPKEVSIPKMVRLKESLGSVFLCQLISFNSKNGAIKSIHTDEVYP